MPDSEILDEIFQKVDIYPWRVLIWVALGRYSILEEIYAYAGTREDTHLQSQ